MDFNQYRYTMISACLAVFICITRCELAASQSSQISMLKNKAPFPVGFAIDPAMVKNNALYRQTIIEQVASLTVANYMKPSRISPQKGVFNFEQADYLIDFAKQQNKRVHGHTLVWYINTAPEWMKAIKDSTELENVLKNYIATVGNHFKGKVASWDVVNEAFNNQDGAVRTEVQDNKGKTVLNLGGILGKDYVARMFQYTHQADPGALLFYNEYGQEGNPKKLESVLNMVADFKKRKIPIHGLGLQMHISISTSDAGIENALQKSADTGLMIHISELDIAINATKKPDFKATPELIEKQKEKYKFVVAAYKRIVPVKQQFGITMWGVGDADSWIPGFCSCSDFPLLFDEKYKPKISYEGFAEGLK
ncbi:endo-1,4-beta-xylanase [Dyadobacter sp. 3J3]|uniref:endo-1,4-beta-xylanase n=1 Tax=Dyadobacter sp. 3J3 TaxID=2606600 RepID=UPI001357E695|nr:endo-1,4-beta-xylanase [Dyadobacter sp. 3J3]